MSSNQTGDSTPGGLMYSGRDQDRAMNPSENNLLSLTGNGPHSHKNLIADNFDSTSDNQHHLNLDLNWQGLLMDTPHDFYNFDFNISGATGHQPQDGKDLLRNDYPSNHRGPSNNNNNNNPNNNNNNNNNNNSNNPSSAGSTNNTDLNSGKSDDMCVDRAILTAKGPASSASTKQSNTPNTSNPNASNTPLNAKLTGANSNNEDANRALKARRPCDHCRRRKTKCVIIPNTNNCAQCEAKSLVCTYIDQPAKRGGAALQFDEYKRSKMSSNDYYNGSSGPPSSGNLTGGTVPGVYSGSSAGSFQVVPPNVQIREVAPVQDYLMVNNSLLKKTLSLQFPRSSFYIGPTLYLFDMNLLNLIIDAQTSNNNGNNNNNNNNNNNITNADNPSGSGGTSGSKIEQVNLSNSISLRKVSDKALFVLKDDQSPQSYLTMSQDVDTIEKFIAPHGQILIDLYFRIIHPSYPILHKKVFLEKYSRTHREFLAPLLAAVYVLAIQWWDYDPQLNRFPKPNSELILKIALNNYVLEILKRPKLSAVQAGLLLLQCKHIILVRHNNGNGNNNGNNNNNSNNDNNGAPTNGAGNMGNQSNQPSSTTDSDYNEWVLCSQIVAIAEELGLGLDCHGWKLPKWERGLRKRLAWAVYMEDKWLALKNSRPLHIHERNWCVLPLADEDFPEKHGDGDLKEGLSDIDNGKKIFRNLIELSMILADIEDQFYLMRAMNEVTDMNHVLKLAKPLQLRLRNWYHLLPIELQMSSVQPRKLCLNGYLQLAYFATELTLHRKIITTVLQQQRSSNPPQQELVNVCRAAARTRLLASIDFVRDLKPEHIHSFWHSSSSSNFTLIGIFATLLFVSSSTKEEEDFYKDQVFNYRWILKISSKGFDQVGAALLKLDLVLNHIPGLLIDKVGMPMVVPNVPTIDYKKRQQNQNQNQNQNQKLQQQNFSQQGTNQGTGPNIHPSPHNFHPSPHTVQQSPPHQSPHLQNIPMNINPNMNMQGMNQNSAMKQQHVQDNQIAGPQASGTANGFRKNDKRMILQLRTGNLPFMSSPQNYTTPPYSVPGNQTARQGTLFGNSPQSSLGLSPKEIIRQQRLVGPVAERDEDIYDPKRSPTLSHVSNGQSIHHSDDNMSIHSKN